MYKKILVALENSQGDNFLVNHVEELAKILESEILLVHVADGWVARNYENMLLKESKEMIEDKKYLEETANRLLQDIPNVKTHLALGDPPDEILKLAAQEHCDLIAMTSHGHKFFSDFFRGSIIEEVCHKSNIPILVVRSPKK